MRRRNLVGAVAAAAAALGGALALLPRSSSPPPTAAPPGSARPGATASAPADSPGPESSAIAGRVVDPWGAPVAGAEVLLGENRASVVDQACDCLTCREKLLKEGDSRWTACPQERP